METVRVQPPANGKKLWRVKYNGSGVSQHEANTIKCLQSSLKITAAAKQYCIKKPQLKRPKNKPGMPKDFVFVDLSPVKDSDDSASNSSSLPSSPALSDTTNDTSISDISCDSLAYADFSNYDDCMQDITLPMDFDMSMMNFGQNVYETPKQQQQPEFETPVNQILRTPEGLHQRSKSVDSIKQKPLQFKTYSPKSPSKKPALTHRHTVSAPVSRQDLDDFMTLNNQIKVDLRNESADSISLSTVESDEEFLQQPLKTDISCIDQFLLHQDAFDFNAFVTI